MSDMKNKRGGIMLEFKERLKKSLGDKFKDMILFGSYAREEQCEDSDIDVMILTKGKVSKEEDDRISEISSEISLRYDKVISCFEYPYSVFISRNSPFLMNVKREGVKI